MLDARESIILKTLQRLPKKDIVLIGGYAVNAYVPPRFSIDCDIVVLSGQSKIESLLKADGFMKVSEGEVTYGGYVRYEMEGIKVSFDLLENSVVDRDTKIVFEAHLFRKHSAERTTVGRSVPTRIRMRIVDPELLFTMKFVTARKQDIRDMFMLAGGNMGPKLIIDLVSAKCGPSLIAKRSRSIKRDVQSMTFRDSLHGPFGRIPDERFELCKRRLVELLETLESTFSVDRIKKAKPDPKDPFLVRAPQGKSTLGDLSKKHDEYLYGTKKSRVSSKELTLIPLDENRLLLEKIPRLSQLFSFMGRAPGGAVLLEERESEAPREYERRSL
jgi:hypothetical protein